MPIATLQPNVDQLISAIRDKLPDRPWYQVDMESGPEWSLLEIEPTQADDYPGQSDEFLCVTQLPMLMQNVFSHMAFDSIRYSRFGEIFCYLKLEGNAAFNHKSVDERTELSDALDAALRPLELGASLGGGTGLQYCYIELALTKLDAAWQVIGTVLANGRIPKRTWLLFHDADLATQWRGVYDDTPSPPMEPID